MPIFYACGFDGLVGKFGWVTARFILDGCTSFFVAVMVKIEFKILDRDDPMSRI